MTFGSGCPTLVNDKELSRCCEIYAKELLGPEKAFSVEELNAMGGGSGSKTAGSEDFAYVSQEVPSVMLGPGRRTAGKGLLLSPAPPYGEVR